MLNVLAVLLEIYEKLIIYVFLFFSPVNSYVSVLVFSSYFAFFSSEFSLQSIGLFAKSLQY